MIFILFYSGSTTISSPPAQEERARSAQGVRPASVPRLVRRVPRQPLTWHSSFSRLDRPPPGCTLLCSAGTSITARAPSTHPRRAAHWGDTQPPGRADELFTRAVHYERTPTSRGKTNQTRIVWAARKRSTDRVRSERA